MTHRALCVKCGGLLDPKFYKGEASYHIGCEPKETIPMPVVFGNPSGGRDAATQQLRQDLIDVIKWADGSSERSQQSEIGPSELGNECDRFIAYRLAQMPVINTMTDPWPAIVGTAIHEWLQRAFDRFQEAAQIKRWDTETTVHPDAFIRGHMDLFDHWLFAVIDWKSKGPTKMKQFLKSGPSEREKDQVNLYAKGKIESGARVDKVCLVALPRSGWLEDMELWVDDYRPERAQAALDRMYSIAQTMDALRVLDNPHLFDAIPATPEMCTFCPYFRPVRSDDRPADATGCPGK